MKLLKSLALAVILILTMCTVVFAQTSPAGMTYDSKSYVTIGGNAGAENAGYEATLMLVKKGANITQLAKDDIGYIGQVEVEEDGKYIFEFSFGGFTFDSDGNVDNYDAIVNVNGEEFIPSVAKTTMKDMVTFDFDFTNFGRGIAKINNEYGLRDLGYMALVAFYDGDKRLLGTKRIDRYSGDSETFTYGYDDIPEGTTYAKGFIWEDSESMIPLAPAGEIDVLGHTTNRSVMTMSISPGKDESERNFAWYDITGVEDVKIQIAQKVTGTASDFESETAQTFDATYGYVDAAKYNGLVLNANNPNSLFNHEGEYTWAKATVTGLEKGMEYVYRVGDKLGWCKDVYDFKTDASPEDGFEVLLLSDEHSRKDGVQNKAIAKIAEKALEYANDPSLVLALGDNVDLPWEEDSYTEYFSREFTNEIPLATVPGPTHDMLFEPNSATLFGYHFNMPNQSLTSGYIEDVCGNYWFTYGDVLFIGLTNNWSYETNLKTNSQFVKEAVDANPDAKWRVLYAHLPFGSQETGNPYNGHLTSEEYGDWVAGNGIDIALFGHLHDAYRTYPMKDGAIVNSENVSVAENPVGTTYVSLNTSGARAGGLAMGSPQDYMAYYDNDVVARVNNTTTPYNSYFSTMSIKTTEAECSLEIKTYKNTADPNHEITSTDLVDTYKIVKTNQ